MSPFRTVGIIALLLGTTHVLRADPPDPLKLIPGEADLILKVEQPRTLIESFTSLDAVRKLDTFAPFRELMESTTARRIFQLVRYYERELGAPWPEMLDQIAGRGVVLAVKYGNYDGKAPALLAIQGKDAAVVKKFFALTISLLEQEGARNDVPVAFQRKTHRGADVVRISDELILAQIEDVILVGNVPGTLDKSLALRESGGKSMIDHPGVLGAKKILPEKPLAWLWYDFEPVKQFPGAKDLFAQPRNDPLLTFFFSGAIDVFKRTPSINVGFYASPDGMRLAMRLPAGQNGRAEETSIHVPPEGMSGSLPLLEPKGVVFSHSFYFDFGALWDKRDKVFNAATAAGFTELDQQASKFLPGTSVPKLFRGAGPYHRFVVTDHRATDYKTIPKQKLPGFAFVSSMRDPDFGKAMEIFIRGGVLAASTQFKLKLVTQEHQGIRIVGYKFPEDAPFPDDPDQIRFNFTPCFARMDDYFVTASTFELCRTIIDEIRKQGKPSPTTSNMRMRLYAEGNADLLNATPDQLLTQAILDQAIPVEQAQQQVKQIIDFVKTLGWVGIEYDYQPNSFELSFQWKHRGEARP